MASALSPQELSSMRAAINDLLPNTCTLYSGSLTADAMGGGTVVWTAGVTVDCRLDPVSAGEGNVAAGLQPFESYLLTVPYDTVITNNHRILVGTVYYHVTGVNLAPSWPLDKRCMVQPVIS